MKKIYLVFIVIISCFTAMQSHAVLYVKYDQNGLASFSDSPLPGYKPYASPQKATIFKSSTPKPAPSFAKPSKVTTPKHNYNVKVLAPSPGETVRSNNGYLLVAGEITPEDIADFALQLYLDNKPFGPSQNSLMFNVENIDRGEHQLKLALVSDTGKVIAFSAPTTFYMHRAMVKRAN